MTMMKSKISLLITGLVLANKNRYWYFLTIFILILTACGDAGGQNAGVTTLICANLTASGGVDKAAVAQFNRTHPDVRIEVRDYLDEDGFSGKDRLMTEIAAGKIPDIIDLGRSPSSFCLLPYQVLARKGYLEDLWPYIDNDPELGRESVLEAPLKAAEVNGGLYVLFDEFIINTLTGAEGVVGDRSGWSLSELQDVFASMPEGSTILPYHYRKMEVFAYMMRMNLDGYVDWETGRCSFDCENFRDALQFVNSFPDEVPYGEDLVPELLERMRHGKQMLWAEPIRTVMDMQFISALLGSGDRISFVGYPSADGGNGSSFFPQRKLAMSSACRDKEAAWAFLREMLLPKYDRKAIIAGEGPVCIPINREDYDTVRMVSQSPDFVPKKTGFAYSAFSTDVVWVEYHSATDEEWAQYDGLINSITKIDVYDSHIYNIVWEAAGAYFAGDKTLDETIQLIENRVGLYVNENR